MPTSRALTDDLNANWGKRIHEWPGWHLRDRELSILSPSCSLSHSSAQSFRRVIFFLMYRKNKNPFRNREHTSGGPHAEK